MDLKNDGNLIFLCYKTNKVSAMNIYQFSPPSYEMHTLANHKNGVILIPPRKKIMLQREILLNYIGGDQGL